MRGLIYDSFAHAQKKQPRVLTRALMNNNYH